MCENFSPSAAVVVKQMFYVHKLSLSPFQPVYFPLMGIGILSEWKRLDSLFSSRPSAYFDYHTHSLSSPTCSALISPQDVLNHRKAHAPKYATK